MPKSKRKSPTTTVKPEVIIFLTQPTHNQAIQNWGQSIENRRASEEDRPPKKISIKEAKRCFKRALQSERSPYGKDVESLVRQLLPQPKILQVLKVKNKRTKSSCPDSSLNEIEVALKHFQKKSEEKENQKTAGDSILLSQQRQVYQTITRTLDAMVKHRKAQTLNNTLNTPLDWEESLDPAMRMHYKKYKKWMGKAVTHDLADEDPYVKTWSVLHYPKPGSSRKLTNPISPEELTIQSEIEKLREKHFSWRHIHRELARQGLISPQSFEAFRKWCARRQIQELFPADE